VPGFELAPENQVWELRALWQYEGERLHGSRHVFVTLRELGTDQATLWQMWDDNCREFFTRHRPTSFQLIKVAVHDLWPGEQEAWEHVYDPPPVGAHSGGDGTPGPATPLLQWLTEYAGRSYRGRTYWGPVREAETLGSFATSDITANIIEYAQSMILTFGTGAALFPHLPGLVVLSRSHNGVPRDVPWVSSVDNAKVDRWLRTNRKRTVDESLTVGAF
jgi:hypothetical protein